MKAEPKWIGKVLLVDKKTSEKMEGRASSVKMKEREREIEIVYSILIKQVQQTGGEKSRQAEQEAKERRREYKSKELYRVVCTSERRSDASSCITLLDGLDTGVYTWSKDHEARDKDKDIEASLEFTSSILTFP